MQDQFPNDEPSNYTTAQANTFHYTLTPPDTPDDLPFTLTEMKHIIQNIPIGITPGTDNFTSSLLKGVFLLYPKLLLQLFNACLDYSYYPEIWKESHEKLIRKPSKPLHIPSSHRPICINSRL